MIVRHRSPFQIARVGAVSRPLAAPFGSAWFGPTFERSVLADQLRDARRRTPVVDTAWVDGALRLTVDLPGVPAEAVSVEVADRVLTVSVATDELRWERRVRLGGALDHEQVSARHVDGRLTVTVGAAVRPEPRRIAVDTTAAAPTSEPAPAPDETPVIDATGSDVSGEQPDDRPLD